MRLSRLRIPSSLVLVLHCTQDTMLSSICQELLAEITVFGRDGIHSCCDVRAILLMWKNNVLIAIRPRQVFKDKGVGQTARLDLHCSSRAFIQIMVV